MQDPPEIEDVIVKLETNLPVCRVCLNVSMEYIDTDSVLCWDNGAEITYSDGFNLIIPHQTLPNNLTNWFCASCGSDLLNAYMFRKRVENANIILSRISEHVGEAKRQQDVNGEEGSINGIDEQESDTDLKENFLQIDRFIKQDEGPQEEQVYKGRKRKKKNTVPEDTWPESPRNSLYTDSDTDSSTESTSTGSHLNEDSPAKESPVWMCTECGEICMSRKMLKRHRKYHQIITSAVTKCKKCEKSLESVEELENHLCFHKFSEICVVDSGKISYRCKLCERKCRSETDFNDHMNIHKDKKPHRCKNCNETFHTKHLLRIHNLRFHRNLQRKKIKPVKRTCIEKKEKCPFCEKMVRISYMEIHKEVHFGPRTCTCSECGKLFKSRLALKTHSVIHIRNGDFVCHICSKICQTSYGLKAHIHYKHSTDNSLLKRRKYSYQCEDCGLTFQYPSKLRIHQRKHNFEAPYKCIHCNRSYIRKDQYNIHMRYHTNYLPYKCDQCEKSYATKNNLTEHKKSVHENITYGCDECAQRFKSITGLRKHKFQHTGYPYICPLCELGQPFRSGMKRHLLRVHNDVYTEEKFDEAFPVLVPKSGFRRPKT